MPLVQPVLCRVAQANRAMFCNHHRHTVFTLFKKYEWLTYSFLCILNCHFKQEKNTQFIFNCQTNQLISYLLKADFHINMFTPSLFSFTPWFTTHRHIHTHKHTAVLIYWSNSLVNPVTMVNYTPFRPVDCLGLSPDNRATQHLQSSTLYWALFNKSGPHLNTWPTSPHRERGICGHQEEIKSFSWVIWSFHLSFYYRYSCLVGLCWYFELKE